MAPEMVLIDYRRAGESLLPVRVMGEKTLEGCGEHELIAYGRGHFLVADDLGDRSCVGSRYRSEEKGESVGILDSLDLGRPYSVGICDKYDARFEASSCELLVYHIKKDDVPV